MVSGLGMTFQAANLMQCCGAGGDEAGIAHLDATSCTLGCDGLTGFPPAVTLTPELPFGITLEHAPDIVGDPTNMETWTSVQGKDIPFIGLVRDIDPIGPSASMGWSNAIQRPDP